MNKHKSPGLKRKSRTIEDSMKVFVLLLLFLFGFSGLEKEDDDVYLNSAFTGSINTALSVSNGLRIREFIERW